MTPYCLIATAIGPVGLSWSEAGLTRLQLPDMEGGGTYARLTKRMNEPVETDPPQWLEPVIQTLQRYFSGKKVDLSQTPVDFGTTSEFFRAIYAETLKLSWGETATYGQLAERAGSAGAAQSVGQAMGRNPVPIVVPCHRVLASGNKIGGFSAPGGTRSKLWLLDMEGVPLNGSNPAQLVFGF